MPGRFFCKVFLLITFCFPQISTAFFALWKLLLLKGGELWKTSLFLPDGFNQRLDVCFQFFVFFQSVFNFVNGVHDSGVVTSP